MQPQINFKTMVLGTGGTIAGLVIDASNPSNYKASQLAITDILRQAGISTSLLELHDVAQIDSKDMGAAVWRRLLQAVVTAQQRADVQAIVITHGTDTLEETAFLLDLMGPWTKPVVLTCAMQPADSPTADGPGNLRDALLLAHLPAFTGVAVVCAGQAHHAQHVQKIRTDQNDAFSSGLRQPLAQMHDGQWAFFEELASASSTDPWGPASGRVTSLNPTPIASLPMANWQRPSLETLLNTADWPRVEWLTNHADADGDMVLDLLSIGSKGRRPLRGLIVAATGAGTVSIGLEEALMKAQAAGVVVWVSSRCVWGKAQFYEPKPWGQATPLNPAKAMVALRIMLLAEARSVE